MPNVSEGRRGDVLEALAEAAGPGHLLDLHADPVHHRAVLSIAGGADSVEAALLRIGATAVERIDLRQHAGVHPRVGVLDVVPIVALEAATIDDAADLARRIGQAIHDQLGLPVFFYGAALGGPPLAAIRAGRAEPDLGGGRHASGGAVCIGARPPLVAYNVLLGGAAPEAARRLAAGLRASAPRGMPGVQALAFELDGGVMQLSMNLVDLALAPPGRVLNEVRRRAEELGIEVGADEVVGLCPAAVAPPAARGRLLECRLAAAAARLGALEHKRPALEQVAAELAPLGPGSEALLAALEGAAGVAEWLDGEARAMLRYAAVQLRGALPAQALVEYPERVRAVDRWLHHLSGMF